MLAFCRMIEETTTILETDNITLSIPEKLLSKNTISISKNGSKSFADWTREDDINTYYLLHKMVLVWRNYYNREDYLVYGTLNKERFSFEGIPFKKKAISALSKIKTLFRILTKGHLLSTEEKENLAKEYHEKLTNTPLHIKKKTGPLEKAAHSFYNPQIVRELESRTIFKGEKIRILIDSTPLLSRKNSIHFLILPIEYKANFQDLSELEYSEAMHYARLLCTQYDMQPHIFHENGKVAGQSVDHWRLHVSFTKSKSTSFSEKFKTLRNILINPNPLTDEKLEVTLLEVKENLLEVLKNNLFFK